MHNVADILPLQLAKLSRCNFASIRTDMQSSRKIVWQSCQSNNSARVGVRMGKRENEAETVRHPLLQQHLRQLQLLYLYLVADWRLYLKDFVQTCRKYSSHIRKLFNKLNAAKKSEKMGKRKTKAESQKLLQAKRKLYQLGRWTGPVQSEARAGQNFSHRAISFACVRCRCLWPQLQLQLQLLFLQLLIK